MFTRKMTPLGAAAFMLLSSTALAATPPDAHPRQKPHAGSEHPHTDSAAKNESVMVTAALRAAHSAITDVSRKDMEKFVAGTSPLKILGSLTGANFVSNDPLGLDIYSKSFYVRGFNQSQLGATLDGIPLGDQSYNKYNGLDVNSAITQDNIARMNLSQGGGDVTLPSTSELGGAMEFYSADPADKAGGIISQMFGSYNSYRTYVKGDTGTFTRFGTKAYISYMRVDGDKWKGYGDQFTQQVNAKIVQPIGDNSSIKAFFNWSDLAQYEYQDLSLELLHKVGQRLDNYAPDYRTAYLAAQGIYPASFASLSDPADAAYYNGGQAERDYLGGLTLDFDMGHHIRWKTLFYGHGSQEYSTWANPYVASPTGAPLSFMAIPEQVRRLGFTTEMTHTYGNNVLRTGVWFENNAYNIGKYYYSEPVLGQGAPIGAVGPFNTYGGPFAQVWGMGFNTNTVQYHLTDTYHVLPGLAITGGFKSLVVTTAGGANENNTTYTHVDQLPNGSVTSSAAFLPHVNIDWHFLKNHEIYFDVAENMRAFTYEGYQSGSVPSLWGVKNQAAFDVARRTLHPERNWTYVVGYHYYGKVASASVDAYRSNFTNRLGLMASGSLVNPTSTVGNLGGVTMNGVDADVVIRPVRHLAIDNSISYNHSTYDNNITSAGVLYHLQGKKVPAYPQFMYKTSLIYSYHGLSAHFDANYISRRYLSYTNDTSVPGFWMTNIGARYSFGQQSIFRDLSVSFDVYNLLNTPYISTVGEQGFPLEGDRQSLLAGSPRQFFGSVSAKF
ncbi:TonB-dependent receptor domain-containing protein [Gluconacetobacter dulcium]|nr:TonB-dependent receptor [Gluconacetobacter dulcium]